MINPKTDVKKILNEKKENAFLYKNVWHEKEDNFDICTH